MRGGRFTENLVRRLSEQHVAASLRVITPLELLLEPLRGSLRDQLFSNESDCNRRLFEQHATRQVAGRPALIAGELWQVVVQIHVAVVELADLLRSLLRLADRVCQRCIELIIQGRQLI